MRSGLHDARRLPLGLIVMGVRLSYNSDQFIKTALAYLVPIIVCPLPAMATLDDDQNGDRDKLGKLLGSPPLWQKK